MLEALGGIEFTLEWGYGVIAIGASGEVRGVWVKQPGFGECHVMLASNRDAAPVWIHVRSEFHTSLL